MPTSVSRVHIVGRYTGLSSNFIVRISGRVVVNDLLGTFGLQTVSEGSHLTNAFFSVVTTRQSSGRFFLR